MTSAVVPRTVSKLTFQGPTKRRSLRDAVLESGRLVRWGLTELYQATPPPGTSALANGPSGTMGGSMYAWEECGATASRAKHWEQALTWIDMDGYVSERGSQVSHQSTGGQIHQG